jgi:hypothetical protein
MDEIELQTITAFGHRFRSLMPGDAEDLVTLEKEGAIYTHWWNDGVGSFLYYRVPFLPAEIVEYVEAQLAKDRFDTAMAAGASFEFIVDER